MYYIYLIISSAVIFAVFLFLSVMLGIALIILAIMLPMLNLWKKNKKEQAAQTIEGEYYSLDKPKDENHKN